MRRKLAVLAAVAVLTSVATAEVWVSVYRCDGTTPLEVVDPNYPNVYRDIMVGTHLALVVNSEVGETWWGGLLMSEEGWLRGSLLGRGFNPNRGSYRDSVLDAAGSAAHVWPFDLLESSRGFELNSTAFGVAPGEWFVFDYFAERTGLTDITLHDFDLGADNPLLEIHSFHQVPSRDYDADMIVNFEDFALLARQWRSSIVSDPNAESTMDLDTDGWVGLADLVLFTDHWVQRTDCNEPAERFGGVAVD